MPYVEDTHLITHHYLSVFALGMMTYPTQTTPNLYYEIKISHDTYA